MSDIVVNKIIKFSADDQLTSPATRIKQLVDGVTKNHTTKFDALTDDSKVQSWSNKINGLSKQHTTNLEAMAKNDGFQTFEGYLKSLPLDQQTKLKAIVDKTGFNEAKAEYKSLPLVKKMELRAEAKKQGFTSFMQMYKAIPKEARTRLNAIVNKNVISDYERELKHGIPNHVDTRFTADTTSARSNINKLGNDVDSTKGKLSRFKDVLAGTFAGTLIANSIGKLTSGLKEATLAGMEYNKEQDTMKTVWTALTTEAPKDGKELVNYINSLSQHSIYAADTINEMSQSFYHVHSNVKETKDWTNSFIALGSTLHMSNSALAESGEMFAKIVAGGKASSEDMAVMINRFPMFGEALQKATGKSMKELYQMSAQGKLSATQFTETLDYLGKKYSGGTKEAMTSYMGMGMYIHSRFSKLMGDIMTQTFDTTKSASGAIRDLLSDDSMQKYAKAIGRATSTMLNGIGEIINYIDGHKDTIMKIGKDVGKIASIFGQTIWNDISGTIEFIAKWFGLVDEHSKSSIDPLNSFEKILSAVAKHKTAIQVISTALLGLFVTKKITNFTSSLGKMKEQLDAISKLKFLNLGGLKDANTYTGLSSLKPSNAKAVTSARWETMSAGAKVATGAVGVGIAADAGIDIYKAIKEKNPTKKFEDFGKATGTVLGGGIGFTLGGPAGALIGSQIGKVLGKAGGDAAKQFSDEWGKAGKKGAKPPEGLVPKASYYTRKAVDGMTAWGRSVGDWSKKHKQEIITTLANPFAGLAQWFLKDTKAGKGFQKWMDGIFKDIQKGFKSFNKQAGKIGSEIVKSMIKSMKTFGKLAEYALILPIGIVATILKPISKPLGKAMSKIVKGLKIEWQVFTKWLGKLFDPVAKLWDKAWKKISKAIKPNTISKNVSTEMDKMTKSVQKSKWAKDLETEFNKSKKTANNWGNNMSDWWSDFSSSFSKSWNSTWSRASSYMGKKFSGLHKTYDNFSSGMNSWWSQFSSSFKTSWNSTWQGVSDMFSKIFGGLKKIAKKAWNGIIGVLNTGIGAINGVITTFGGNKLTTVKPLETGSNYHRGGLAKINDANSSVYREIVKEPSGRMYSPMGKNVITYLPAGSSVMPAQQAKPYVESGMIPAYEDGIGNLSNFFDSATSNISDKLGDVGSWVSSKIKDIGGDFEKGIKFATDFIKDPVGNLTKAFESITKGKWGKEEFSAKMGPATGKGVIKAIKDKVKSMAESFKKSLESVTVSGGSMPATAYGPMIKAAAAFMHQSISDFNVDMIERIIGNESGGNTHAINLTDSNAKAGHPSKGILQYIDGTFMNYAMPGHTNIWNPLDQLIALFNDSTWRSDMGMGYNGKYGEWRGQASGPSGPRLMENGGHVWNATRAIIGEAGDEFAINPSKASAIPLTASLINRLGDFHPQIRTSNLTSNLSADVGNKLQTVINLLSSINGKNFEPQISIARTSDDMNQQNRRDTDIYAYQQGRRQ